MEISERSVLIDRGFHNFDRSRTNSGLSAFFAIVCIIDVFGVFPVISLAKPILDCGYAGVAAIVFVCSVQVYTAVLLTQCWIVAEEVVPSIQFKSRYPYSALTEIAYGSSAAKLVNVLLGLTVFGGGIPNLIVASQNLQVLGLKLSEGTFDMSYCYWMVVLGTIMCPFLWLGSPKDMKLLCTVSATLVVFVFVMILGCILSDHQIPSTISDSTLQATSLWQSLLTAYGILAFQFDIHPTILSIQMDMKDRSKVSKAIIGGFIVSLSLFSIICVTAFYRYKTNVGASILETLPSTKMLYFAAVLVTLQLTLSSAIGNTALYQHIEDYMGIPRDFNYKRCVTRSFLATLSVIVAESVPRFNLVMSLVGGALTGPLVFILPPLLYIKILSLKQKNEEVLQSQCFQPLESETSFHKLVNEINVGQSRTRPHRSLKVVFCSFIIAFGVTATTVTTYINIANTIKFVTFSPPCIFNMYNGTVKK